MTSCGRHCRGASASASTNRCIRWIVGIAHFSAGIGGARRVRGERPLYTTKDVSEKCFILIDGVSTQLHKYVAGRGRARGRPTCQVKLWCPRLEYQLRPTSSAVGSAPAFFSWYHAAEQISIRTLDCRREGDLLTDWMRSAVVVWRYVAICGSTYQYHIRLHYLITHQCMLSHRPRAGPSHPKLSDQS